MLNDEFPDKQFAVVCDHWAKPNCRYPKASGNPQMMLNRT